MEYGVLGFTDTHVDRQTSGLLSGLSKKFKTFLGDIVSVKDVWRAGRTFIDAFAGAAGIPAATLRQQLRNDGVDPNGLNHSMERLGPDGLSDSLDEANQQVKAAEDQNRTLPKISTTLLVVLGAVVLFGGGLFGLGGGGRGRRAFRHVRMHVGRSFRRIGRRFRFRGRRRRR